MRAYLETPRPRPGYRPCVGIVLLDRLNRVFVGQRVDTVLDAWQMPQGGIDQGETPVAAALREMREEIGTDRARLLAESRVWRSYDLPRDLARQMWGGRFRGQTQRWLAFRFEGRDEDIRIDLPPPEFRAWRWVEPDRLIDLIVPFKRDVYVSVVDEFRRLWA
ncbi:MAG TPA: RNA pyrophosphohydrolase [Geminicoccaceae bacterium]|nr:RNA pyrophosphohydrolase [Geminicoccaceae bacterium]